MSVCMSAVSAGISEVLIKYSYRECMVTNQFCYLGTGTDTSTSSLLFSKHTVMSQS